MPNSRENVLIETVLVLLNQIGDVTLSNLEVLKMWAKQPISCQIAHQEIDPKDTVDTDVAPVSKSPSMIHQMFDSMILCQYDDNLSPVHSLYFIVLSTNMTYHSFILAHHL